MHDEHLAVAQGAEAHARAGARRKSVGPIQALC